MRAFLVALLSILLVVLVAPRVLRADVPPPNVAQCNGKTAGDTCTTDDSKPGACASSTCSKLDYSDGTPPGTTTYPCLICTAGTAPSSTTTSTSSGSTTPTQGGSGCSLAVAARVAGAGGLAVIVPAIALLARRRRRVAR